MKVVDFALCSFVLVVLKNVLFALEKEGVVYI